MAGLNIETATAEWYGQTTGYLLHDQTANIGKPLGLPLASPLHSSPALKRRGLLEDELKSCQRGQIKFGGGVALVAVRPLPSRLAFRGISRLL